MHTAVSLDDSFQSTWIFGNNRSRAQPSTGDRQIIGKSFKRRPVRKANRHLLGEHSAINAYPNSPLRLQPCGVTTSDAGGAVWACRQFRQRA